MIKHESFTSEWPVKEIKSVKPSVRSNISYATCLIVLPNFDIKLKATDIMYVLIVSVTFQDKNTTVSFKLSSNLSKYIFPP